MRSRLSMMSLVAMLMLGLLGWSPSEAQTYWYESYETAVQLIDDGKVDQAYRLLDTLIEAYPEPAATVRIPGNRFVTYAPYYQRGRIEFLRGQYAASFESLHISKAFGAIKEDRHARTDAERLLQLIPDRQKVSAKGTSKAVPKG